VYDSLHPCQERYYSGLVAEHLDLPIHYIVADQHPLLAHAVQWTRPLEHYQPSLWLEFNRQALQHGRVMLTGTAGDNLLHYSSALPTVAEANPLHTLRQIVQLTARYGQMPGLGTGLKARLRKMAGKTAEKSAPYPYPPWLNQDLEQKLAMRDRWDAYWIPTAPDANAHPRHPRLYDSLMSPSWNTDDFDMNGTLTTPEVRDPYLDLRLVEFLLSISPMPWLYRKHILRESMKSSLPKSIIERPKEILGALASSLVQQTTFQADLPSGNLLKYIDAAAFRKTTAGIGDIGLDYVNLRPLILRRWLQML
jgi:asparagine synthase (glutamine-hydrolysing)